MKTETESIVVRRVMSTLVNMPYAAAGLSVPSGAKMSTPGAVCEFIAEQIQNEAQEVFCALVLDNVYRVIGYYEISRGTVNKSIVHPRDVFGPAIRVGGSAVIVAHNHPSGDTVPSAGDRALTRRLIEAGKLLGVPVLDHVLCGREAYSFREDGFEF